MKQFYILALLLISTPNVVSAQTLITFINTALQFVNIVIIPALLSVAFVIFTVNAVRFFIIGDSNDEKRENAKNLAIYSVSAFVLIVTLWGLVNLLASSIGLDNKTAVPSDYMEKYTPPAP
jgi:succinate dehydrogenase/fumarate reductase cytochrome b subunit